MVQVPIVDLSNIGNGTIVDFSEHAIFSLDGDLGYLETNPALRAFAGVALSTGEPQRIPGPCSDSCSYSISIDGLLFTCQDVPTSENNILSDHGLIYKAEDRTGKTRREGNWNWQNMTFVINWVLTPSIQFNKAAEIRGLACSTLLATYTLDISYRGGLQSVNTTVKEQSSPWTNAQPIVQQYYDYFTFIRDLSYDGPVVVNDTMRQQLTMEFTRTQAFAIRDAAIGPLLGWVYNFADCEVQSTRTNLTLIMGSDFVTRNTVTAPRFNISAEGLQNYLQNVVISTIALNPANKPIWRSRPIKVSSGAIVYTFSEPWQFYAPYGASLLVTFLIYGVGIWSLY
ncbi:hypothetical protein EJ08DRAFT_737476 [Tothia fuscella]|uniref:Transmembrane protein n=1 Tax=Tothia fuscella TaxID=1048955 RepID=A0A9P4TV33_9PEZI|nr:hypothetical protein EJ08DRAFT_737476 [Tothia fuscella]